MKVCVPIKVRTAQEALRIAEEVRRKGISLVEIWADPFSKRDQKKVFGELRKPYIVKSINSQALMEAVQYKPNFIDIDFFTPRKEILKLKEITRRHGTKIIVSFHDFKKTPPLPHLLKISRKSFALGADIVKIATSINHFEENVTLFELTKKVSKNGQKIIALGMGEKGKISRIGCALLGGYLTYVAFDKKHRTASGQLLLKDF